MLRDQKNSYADFWRISIPIYSGQCSHTNQRLRSFAFYGIGRVMRFWVRLKRVDFFSVLSTIFSCLPGSSFTLTTEILFNSNPSAIKDSTPSIYQEVWLLAAKTIAATWTCPVRSSMALKSLTSTFPMAVPTALAQVRCIVSPRLVQSAGSRELCKSCPSRYRAPCQHGFWLSILPPKTTRMAATSTQHLQLLGYQYL